MAPIATFDDIAAPLACTPPPQSCRSSQAQSPRCRKAAFSFAPRDAADVKRPQTATSRSSGGGSRPRSGRGWSPFPTARKYASPAPGTCSTATPMSGRSPTPQQHGTTSSRSTPLPRPCGCQSPELPNCDEGVPTIRGFEQVVPRIVGLFDPQGRLRQEAPKHWALISSQPRASSLAWLKSTPPPSQFCLRRQELSARRTLEQDQKRSAMAAKIRYNDYIEQMGLPQQMQEVQHQREFNLFFEPLTSMETLLPQDMLHELHKEFLKPGVHEEPQSAEGLSFVSDAGKDMRSRGRMQLDTPPASKAESASKESLPEDRPQNQLSRVRSHHGFVHSVFQRYIMRVCGPDDREFMQRGTWLRFLHHGGLLGPDGGFPFSKAASVFDEYSEVIGWSRLLSYSNWLKALHHIGSLRKPQSPTRQGKAGPSRGSKSMTAAASLSGEARITSNPFIKYVLDHCDARLKSSEGPEETGDCTSVHGPFTWQTACAEEQACEPEVLQLLHEFQVPLKHLFLSHADQLYEQDDEEERGSSGSDQLDSDADGKDEGKHQDIAITSMQDEGWFLMASDDEADDSSSWVYWSRAGGIDFSKSVPRQQMLKRLASKNRPQFHRAQSAYGQLEGNPARSGSKAAGKDGGLPLRQPRMTLEKFKAMVESLGLHPQIVQRYSLQRHVEISLARRGGAQTDLSYSAWLETLLRICFTYLSAYGNDMQREQSSKRKALWFLALLQCRCRSLDMETSSLSYDALWTKRSTFDLDATPLKSLVLWRTLDARACNPTLPSMPPTEVTAKQKHTM